MAKLSRRSCRIRNDVRDSKIHWDALSIIHQNFDADHDRQQAERVFPRTQFGEIGECYERRQTRSDKSEYLWRTEYDSTEINLVDQQTHREFTFAECQAFKPKVKLPTFDGSSLKLDFLDWIDTFEDYFEAVNLPDDVKCELVASKLKGEACLWWKGLQNLRFLEGKNSITSWPGMRELLITKFLHTSCLTYFHKKKNEGNMEHTNCLIKVPSESHKSKLVRNEADIYVTEADSSAKEAQATENMMAQIVDKRFEIIRVNDHSHEEENAETYNAEEEGSIHKVVNGELSSKKPNVETIAVAFPNSKGSRVGEKSNDKLIGGELSESGDQLDIMLGQLKKRVIGCHKTKAEHKSSNTIKVVNDGSQAGNESFAFKEKVKVDFYDVDFFVNETITRNFDPGGNAAATLLVEGLWNELNMLSSYHLVAQLGNHFFSHFTDMHKQSECPLGWREDAYPLLCVPTIFADLSEFKDLINIFLERYGSSVECSSKGFAYKLMLEPFSTDTQQQSMQEKGINSRTETFIRSYNFELVMERSTLKLGSEHVVWPIVCDVKPIYRFVPASVDAYLTPFIKEFLNRFLSQFDVFDKYLKPSTTTIIEGYRKLIENGIFEARTSGMIENQVGMIEIQVGMIENQVDLTVKELEMDWYLWILGVVPSQTNEEDVRAGPFLFDPGDSIHPSSRNYLLPHRGILFKNGLQVEENDEKMSLANVKKAICQNIISSHACGDAPVVSSIGMSDFSFAGVSVLLVVHGETVAEYRIVVGIDATGFKCEIGEYTCLLIVNIQSQWHLKRFRNELFGILLFKLGYKSHDKQGTILSDVRLWLKLTEFDIVKGWDMLIKKLIKVDQVPFLFAIRDLWAFSIYVTVLLGADAHEGPGLIDNFNDNDTTILHHTIDISFSIWKSIWGTLCYFISMFMRRTSYNLEADNGTIITCGHDKNNANTKRKFIMVEMSVVITDSYGIVLWKGGQSRETLKLFHNMVNGLDPPTDLDGACGAYEIDLPATYQISETFIVADLTPYHWLDDAHTKEIQLEDEFVIFGADGDDVG